jgi:hypothetical protein
MRCGRDTDAAGDETPTESCRAGSDAGRNCIFAAWRGTTTMPCWESPCKPAKGWAVAPFSEEVRGPWKLGDALTGPLR